MVNVSAFGRKIVNVCLLVFIWHRVIKKIIETRKKITENFYEEKKDKCNAIANETECSNFSA